MDLEGRIRAQYKKQSFGVRAAKSVIFMKKPMFPEGDRKMPGNHPGSYYRMLSDIRALRSE